MLQRSWTRFLLCFAIALITVLARPLLTPVPPFAASAQIFPPLSQPAESTVRSRIVVQRQGNIEYADVRLDGMLLFPVAAPVRENQAESGTAGETTGASVISETGDVMAPPSARQRVEQVENNLAIVLANNPDPDQIRVVAGSLNNQSVLFVSDRQQGRSLQIVTLTDLDVKLAGKPKSEVILDWVMAIRTGLTESLQQRQPRYLWGQARLASKVLAGMVLLSLILAYVQRLLKRRWNWLHQVNRNEALEMRDKMQDEMQGMTSMHELAALKPLQYLSMRLPQLTFTRKRNIILILRRLLQWVQVTIWLGGSIWILTLFPQTREFSQWLAQVPVRLLGIVLVMGLIDRLGAVFIDYSLQVWAEQEAINPTGFHRQACRVPTFSVALKGLLMVICIGVGLIWALYELRVPIAPVLTGAGILGFAFSLSAQNLIKDMINGGLILLEDQYAVGDVIAVDNVTGFVEHMSLRITQLRTPDGELVSVPNGAISMVRNLSNGWSRVNFEIEVSYETDIDQALGVMEDVIEQMRCEPEWKEKIIETPEILGVDKLAHTGILIRIWIKTQPLQQWSVSREFRRRLRQAFEAHGIPIGVPQQFLWVKNAHELTTLEQAMRSRNGQDSSSPEADTAAIARKSG